MSWWARSRLRTRIFIAFSALLLAVLIATLGFTQWVVSREAERTLRHELVTTGEVFERLVRERATRLQIELDAPREGFRAEARPRHLLRSRRPTIRRRSSRRP